MEKKTIWHTPQEKISAYKLVLFCFKNCEIHVERSDELGRLRYGTSYVPEDWMDKWAYIDDLIATSKALDVAIDALNAIKDWDADNPKEPFHIRPYQVRAIQNFAHNKSKEINRIMKGCK